MFITRVGLDGVPLDFGSEEDVIAGTPFVGQGFVLFVPTFVQLPKVSCRDELDTIVKDVINAALGAP